MPLVERLAAIRQGADKRIPADTRAITHRATNDLRASGIMDHVIKVGNPLPPFELKTLPDKKCARQNCWPVGRWF